MVVRIVGVVWHPQSACCRRAQLRLEFLKEVAPRVRHAAFLWNPDHPDNELRETQRAARSLNMRLQLVEMRGSGDLDHAFRAVIDGGCDALYVVSSRHTVLNIPPIVDFATRNKLPLAGGWGAWARAGGLLSYGPNFNDMTRRVVDYVDKILNGQNGRCAGSATTNSTLSSTPRRRRHWGHVPPALLARADEATKTKTGRDQLRC